MDVKVVHLVVGGKKSGPVVVPSNLICTPRCYYPKYQDKKLEHAVSTCEQPQFNWPNYEFEVISTQENYSAAACNIQSGKGKRIVYTRKIYTPSTPEDFATIQSEQSAIAAIPSTSRDSPPVSVAQGFFGCEKALNFAKEEEVPNLASNGPSRSLTLSFMEGEELPNLARSNPKRALTLSNDDICIDETPVPKKILATTNALVYRVEQNGKVLKRLANQQRQQSDFEYTRANTVDELKALKIRLEDPTQRDSFIAFIVGIGGKNPKDAIKHAWQAIATDNNWCQYNWEGRPHAGRPVNKPG